MNRRINRSRGRRRLYTKLSKWARDRWEVEGVNTKTRRNHGRVRRTSVFSEEIDEFGSRYYERVRNTDKCAITLML